MPGRQKAMRGTTRRPVARVPIRGKGWTKSSTIAADKYVAISKAILASLTKKPMRFTELVERVARRAEPFPGSVAWYTITCLRELETRGRVVRHRKPTLYSKR